MRFLADESCHFAVVRALAALGHDVEAVARVQRGAPDDEVLNLAARQHRILLTADKDFGRIYYTGGPGIRTVILMRYAPQYHASLCAAVSDLVAREGDRLLGSFIVVQPGQIRIGRSFPE